QRDVVGLATRLDDRARRAVARAVPGVAQPAALLHRHRGRALAAVADLDLGVVRETATGLLGLGLRNELDDCAENGEHWIGTTAPRAASRQPSNSYSACASSSVASFLFARRSHAANSWKPSTR